MTIRPNQMIKETKKQRKEEEKSLLRKVEIQNLKMKIIENLERKQWTIEYSPYRLNIISPQSISLPISEFSDEIIYMIFDYLNVSDILEILCMSKGMSKFSINYLYEHPRIFSCNSLNQFLLQYQKVKMEKPLNLSVFIKSLTFTSEFYNDVIRNFNTNNNSSLSLLTENLAKLFNESYKSLTSLSFNFQINHPDFNKLFMPIFNNYTFSNLNTLRIKNPTKDTLDYLLSSIPNLYYICQDSYTNSLYVSSKDIFSLDPISQNNIKNFHYSLGEPDDSNFKYYLKSKNLGLWHININNNTNNSNNNNENKNENENGIINSNRINNQELSKFTKSFPNALNINLNQNLNDEVLEAISRCSNLIELRLYNGNFTFIGLCDFFSGSGFYHTSFKYLKYLNLDYCLEVDDVVIKYIANQCPNLVTLSLNGCKRITDCAMDNISKQLIHLTKLDLSRTRLTTVGLWQLSKLYCLSHLNVLKCFSISLEGLIEFIKSTHSYFFSISCLSQQEKYKNGCIGLDDYLFYDVTEELKSYASNEIEKLKELQNNFKMYQMQNDISSLNLNSNTKRKYQQQSISSIFLSRSKR
ncbi:hypothetical protein BCR32DRAFT_291518 [Anaeromyces robustus]|uniref:RNI-like protein n=1 Tax=Anaeromyces robustus TaxID=1754192 RepID=A0A1Y1XEL6_9FUNG|nr:hypothetical protein BCR32DRAFT_291518 [Anaeromyces robustus]|eukprot:ORX84189.1 hypothetical protein BCR32DRAFT_291518 [Anaeromyces robustus]